MPKHEGVALSLGGEERVIPPLSLRALRKLGPEIKVIAALAEGELPTEEQMSAIVKIIHEAIKRNYPDVMVEEVEDWVDLGNLGPIMQAVMSMAGLEKRLAAVQGGATRPVT